MTSHYALHGNEVDRERLVRTVPCPTCNAVPGNVCWYDGTFVTISHTGRYDRAVSVGLVRPMVVAHG